MSSPPHLPTPPRRAFGIRLSKGILGTLSVLWTLSCMSTPTFLEQTSIRVDPRPEALEYYRDTARCLGKDPERVRSVEWFWFDIDPNGLDHNGYWTAPHRIFLSDRVWSNLHEDFGEFVVRHEAVHDLTGDLDHEGPHWRCQFIQEEA